MASTVAHGTPESLGPGGIDALGWFPGLAFTAASLASRMDVRYQSLNGRPQHFFFGDVVNPFPLPNVLPILASTGTNASPVRPTFRK